MIESIDRVDRSTRQITGPSIGLTGVKIDRLDPFRGLMLSTVRCPPVLPVPLIA